MTPLIVELALRTGLSTTDVSRIVDNAPKRYKVYEIPKRSGGTRTIAQPSRELKALQRILIDCVLNGMPVHPAAMAYEAKRSIALNAQAHSQSRAILKLDFRNFFTSILTRDLLSLLNARGLEFDRGDLRVLLNVLFWGKGGYRPICLSIGAPSSPKLSNLVMYDIDAAAISASSDAGLTYTRYADDVTVSGRTIEQLLAFEKQFRHIISSAPFPTLRFNNKKRGVYVRGQRQMVTGLIITPESSVSIGRERKRLISAMLHRASLGELSVKDLDELRGLLGFVASVEPQFLDRLRHKYGVNVLDGVRRSLPPQ